MTMQSDPRSRHPDQIMSTTETHPRRSAPLGLVIISTATFYIIAAIMLLTGFGLWASLLAGWVIGILLSVLAALFGSLSM